MIAVFTLVMLFDILMYTLFANLLVPLFFGTETASLLPSVIIFLPPCAYLAVNIALKNFSPNFMKTRGQIRTCLKVAFIPLVLLLFRGYEYLVQTYYFHHLFALIACGICLSRILLNDEKTVSNPKCIAFNLGLTACVFSALFIIGSPFVLSVLINIFTTGLTFVYMRVIVPVLLYVINFIAWLISLIIRGNFAVDEGWFDTGGEPQEIDEFVHASELEIINIPEFVQWILTTIFIALVALLVFKAVKRLIKGRMQKNPGTKVFRSHIIDLDEKVKRDERPSFFTPKDPRLAIRRNYRRFLKICAEKGNPPVKGNTTMEIYQKNIENFSDLPMNRLRELYLKAKYSDKQINKTEGKESGDLLKHF